MRKILILLFITYSMLYVTSCSDDISLELIEIQLNDDNYWCPNINEEILVIINSREEYQEIVGVSDININFRKHALLLIKGTSPNKIWYIDSNLIEELNGDYTLSIEVIQNSDWIQPADNPWFRSFLVPKYLVNRIKLDLSYTYKSTIKEKTI